MFQQWPVDSVLNSVLSSVLKYCCLWIAMMGCLYWRWTFLKTTDLAPKPAVSLCIHVFAWRRPKSLRRLLKSLSELNTPGSLNLWIYMMQSELTDYSQSKDPIGVLYR
jgi:hypothetical protein